MELNIISKTLDRAFGMQLALEISAYFILITELLYHLYTVFTNTSVERWPLRVTVLVGWITVYFIQLLIINRTCENISYEVIRFYACSFITRLNKIYYGN